ncbi:MAG: PAS domain-containing protein [Janthinobacterium lividum]
MTPFVYPAPTGHFLSDALLDSLGIGIIYLTPVYAPHDPTTLVALDYARVTAQAQLLLGLPEPLPRRFGTAGAEETALFAFCRDAFGTDNVQAFTPGYEAADGSRWRVVAQRHEIQLVVSFTPSRTCPVAQPAPETAYTEQVPTRAQVQQLSQEVEAARAEAETQRQQLASMFAQAPVAMAYTSGPDLRIEAINPAACRIWGSTPAALAGLPMLEAFPQLRGQGFDELLLKVLRTGEPFIGQEIEAPVQRDGQLVPTWFNFVHQPLRNEHHDILGVLTVATDVSEQVRARQQVQSLNAELETRVAMGLAEAQHARAEAERLARFFQQAPVAISVHDGPELVYELVNPQYQALFPGRPLLGLPLREALPEILDQPVWQQLHRVYATGETHEEVSYLVALAPHAGGPLQDRYLHYVLQARYDARGRIDGVLVMVLDSTAQVRVQQHAERLQEDVLAAAQRGAQEREAFYQIFEQTPAVISLMRGPDHYYEYVNPAYQALFPGRALQGRPVLEALPEAGPQGFVDLLNQVYQTGETFVGTELPLVITSPDGEPPTKKRLSFTYQAYRENGVIVGVSVFATDVTEQVHARQQREAGLQQLHTIFEQTPVGLVQLTGPDYVVEVANPAICAIWGRERSAVLGQPLFAVLPEIVDQGIPELLDEVRRTGIPFIGDELPLQLLRYGQLQVVYFQFVYQPLTDSDGRVSAVAVVSTDVSAQVLNRQQLARANEELRAANTQLTHTNTDLDNFIYTASHDLKAPIANIESLLLLLRKQLPAEAQEAGLVPRVLGMMQESVERFRLTIAQLTDLSQLQQVRTEPGQAVDLATVIEAVRLDLAPMLEATGTQLRVDVSACEAIRFAPQHLRSIIFNLLSNAIKYRHPARVPQVQVRCRRTEKQAVLEVQDNGLGLSEAQQGKLFTLFQRLHTHVEGSGVGLYMVKRIVENAGGTIQVHSELGVGSTFSVFFPADAVYA